MSASKAPRHLSAEAKRVWRRVMEEYAIDDAAGRLILEQALESLDRLREAQALLQRDGLIITTPATGAKHLHPAARVEKEARAALLTAWKALNLDIEPPGPVGRPPGG